MPFARSRPTRAAWNGFPNGCDLGHAAGRSHRRRPPRTQDQEQRSRILRPVTRPRVPAPRPSCPRRPLPRRLAVESWRTSSPDSPICTAPGLLTDDEFAAAKARLLL